MHGAKDFWGRLLWLADIAELVQASGQFDWEGALAAAQELGCGRLVRVAVLLASHLLEAPAPQWVLERATADRTAQRLARCVIERLFTDPLPHSFERLRFRMQTVEGFWPGARYAWRLATRPTTQDREAVRLPPGLDFLHRILRPVRLLGGGNRR